MSSRYAGDRAISRDAEIAADVEVGPFTVIYGNVVIASGTAIGSHCVVGHPAPEPHDEPLRIGAGARIRSHSVLYEGSTFGPMLETGHHATLREGIRAGENLRVGTHADLQGDTDIGDFVRIHSGAFICRSSKIEDFVWVFPRAVFTEDPHPPSDGCNKGPHIHEYAVIAAAATLLPGVQVGAAALVGAHSLVTKDVAPGELVAGVPARSRGALSQLALRDGSGGAAYPWTGHFRRGYPDHVVERWARGL